MDAKKFFLVPLFPHTPITPDTQYTNPFSNSSMGDPTLSTMVSCKNPPLTGENTETKCGADTAAPGDLSYIQSPTKTLI